MKRSILEIYALAVCFFTVACFVFMVGYAAWYVLEICAPKFTIGAAEYQRHKSDNAFRESLVSQHNYDGAPAPPSSSAPGAGTSYVPPEGAALKAAREKSLQQLLDVERRHASQDLVENSFFLCITVVVFAVHWKLAARARQNVT
jgi:hypothetical protein